MNDMTPVNPLQEQIAQHQAQIQAYQKDLQGAQDMINVLSDQRNAANNQIVNLSAQIQASNRQHATEVSEKDAKIAALEAQVEKLGMSQDGDAEAEADLTE